MRSHHDYVALNYNFYDVLRLNTTNSSILVEMKKLRHRCLDPGLYVKHLRKWLFDFPAWQLLAIDGDELKTQPHLTMLKVQQFMLIDNVIDFQNLLIYSRKKKNYCLVNYDSHTNKNTTKCLGASKGRKYPRIDSRSRSYLNAYFNKSNFELFKLLKRKKFQIPEWLNKVV
jgi:hypothetical protein